MQAERPEGGNAASGAEQRWEARALEGLAAFDAGRIDDAYAAWRSAAAMTGAFDADDPRRAASRTHLALCRAAGGDTEAARRAFRRALRAWEAAEAWVARMAIPQRARSSGFHLRLEAKHPGGYDAIARAEFARLLGAGRAAALAGSAHLARDPMAALEGSLALRAAGLGRRDAGQALIMRAIATCRQKAGDEQGAQDARQRAQEIERDPVRFGPGRLAATAGALRAGDLRRLEAAVYLTPVCLRRR